MVSSKPLQVRRFGQKPLLLTRRMEEILRAVYFYRYMSALDVAYRVYTPGALTRVRKRLTELSGGEDFVPRQYLYRFQLPGVGNAERVYTLGSRGRDYLAKELGMPVRWYFRPEYVKHFSRAHVEHSLLLTRVLVTADWWGRSQGEIRLSAVRVSYELGETPGRVRLPGAKGREETVAVVPDAWLLFERSDGKRAAVLFEIDRGGSTRRPSSGMWRPGSSSSQAGSTRACSAPRA
jgi:hypothetical protein